MSAENSSQPVPQAAIETEAELEAFRRQWREEVSARKQPAGATSTSKQTLQKETESRKPKPPTAGITASTARRKDAVDFSEDIEPRAYHDLPDKEDNLQLGSDGRREAPKEPSSALEHYEHAVEKETQGHLGDSIRHYRKAFKLDDGVHEAYKRKHFPASSFAKPKTNTVHNSKAPPTASKAPPQSPLSNNVVTSNPATEKPAPATTKQLIEEFSTLHIEPAEPPTNASPPEPCPIATLPEEILITILADLASQDIASYVRLAQVCKRLAYLVLTEERIWKRIVHGTEFGFAAMHYTYACEIDGQPLQDHTLLLPPAPLPSTTPAFHDLTATLLRTTYANSWMHMFRTRPRLRFNGCYISTVNYTRAGATSTNTLTWGAPVHVVTYFRYLRFFRDGSVISLLTTAEPADVVHHLTKANLANRHHFHAGSLLPGAPMKDALKGRWRLTGPAASFVPPPLIEEDPPLAPAATLSSLYSAEGAEAQGLSPAAAPALEVEGDVLIEMEGVVPKYMYKMHFALAHAGKPSSAARNNKLAWKGFYSYNKLSDDWGEFGLRNDRAFYWSRVRSYGLGF